MSTPPGPTLGPCVAWCSGEDVALCRGDLTASEFSLFDGVAVEASMLLFEISGRQFSGLCSQTVRPCRVGCDCLWWLPAGVALPSWGFWPGYGWGWGRWDGDAFGSACGCTPESRVKLAGYPVRAITEVLIDGVAVPELDGDGDPNWRLDGWRWLTRMDKPGTPVEVRRWPGCQNLSLAETEAGTFAVTYQFGVSPPPLGVQAAAQLASELYNACGNDECKLPSRVVKIVRQGITYDRVAAAATAIREGASGLTLVDAFIAGYGTGARRRPAVFSPDVQRFARRVGT